MSRISTAGAVETLYAVSSEVLLTGDTSASLGGAQITRFAAHQQNPILTLATSSDTLIFLDLKARQISKYSLDISDEQSVKSTNFCCQDVVYLEEGRTMVCLFDNNLL